MNSMTLMTLIFISLMTFTTATSTNITFHTPNMIVSFIPMEYTTSNGEIGYLIMPSYSYINVSSTPNDDSFNASSFFTDLFGYICYIYTYKYFITNAYFIIINAKRFIEYLETIEPTINEPINEPIIETTNEPINEPIIEPTIDTIKTPNNLNRNTLYAVNMSMILMTVFIYLIYFHLNPEWRI